MSGTDGKNGIGWITDFGNDERITIRLSLIGDNFDMPAALEEMRRVRAEYMRSEQEYYDEEARRSADPQAPRPGRVVRPCTVYRFFDRYGRLLYVGKALDPRGRQKQHERRAWWLDVDTTRTTYELFESERAALDAEDIAIRDENPLYNRVGGDQR